MSNNCTFDKMLTLEGPLTVEAFVELNWFGEKSIADLTGEDWVEVWDFQDKLLELYGEETE